MKKVHNKPTREHLVELASKSLSTQSDLRSKFSKAFMGATFAAFSHFEFITHLRFECGTEKEMQKLTKLVDMAGFLVLNEKFEDGFMEIDASFESPSFIASRAAISELGTSAEDAHTCANVEISMETEKMIDEHFNNQAKKAAEEGKFEYRFSITDLHRNVAKSVHDTLVTDLGLSVRTDYSPTVTKFIVSWGSETEGTLTEEGGFYDGSENE